MQSLVGYVRFGLAGLLLDSAVYRQQRESSNRLRDGIILILLVGMLVGLATLIGNTIESLVSPSNEAVKRTLYEGLTAMPWYRDLRSSTPEFETEFSQRFEQVTQTIELMKSGGILGNALGIVTVPLTYVISWLLYGSLTHLVARLLGGNGTLSQTLGCTALAADDMLGVVEVIPFAQITGVALLSLIANYLAVRTAHELPPWRAFWATILGPLLVLLLAVGILCLFIALMGNVVGGQ